MTMLFAVFLKTRQIAPAIFANSICSHTWTFWSVMRPPSKPRGRSAMLMATRQEASGWCKPTTRSRCKRSCEPIPSGQPACVAPCACLPGHRSLPMECEAGGYSRKRTPAAEPAVFLDPNVAEELPEASQRPTKTGSALRHSGHQMRSARPIWRARTRHDFSSGCLENHVERGLGCAPDMCEPA